MKAVKRNSGLYAYLKAANLLGGSADAIAQAKQDYVRQSKASWRKAQRRRTKQYTIALTPKEAKHMAALAQQHTRSVTRYVKEAAFCYGDKRYLVPDELAIGMIRQLLAMNYAVLQDLRDTERIGADTGRVLLFRMAELEHAVLSVLNNPKEQ